MVPMEADQGFGMQSAVEEVIEDLEEQQTGEKGRGKRCGRGGTQVYCAAADGEGERQGGDEDEADAGDERETARESEHDQRVAVIRLQQQRAGEKARTPDGR